MDSHRNILEFYNKYEQGHHRAAGGQEQLPKTAFLMVEQETTTVEYAQQSQGRTIVLDCRSAGLFKELAWLRW